MITNIDIARRGIMLIVSSPSGAGKTSLLSVLGTALQPTVGLAEVLALRLTSVSEPWLMA